MSIFSPNSTMYDAVDTTIEFFLFGCAFYVMLVPVFALMSLHALASRESTWKRSSMCGKVVIVLSCLYGLRKLGIMPAYRQAYTGSLPL